MAAICITTGNHAVAGALSHQKPRISPWSVVLLSVKGKEEYSAVVLMSTDLKLRKRDIEGFSENP